MMKENNVYQAVQLGANFPQPISSSQRVQLTGAAIIIQNAGDDDITINNAYTVPAEQCLEIGASQDYNVIFLDLYIKFAGVGVAPKVQFIELRPLLPQYANYSPK